MKVHADIRAKHMRSGKLHDRKSRQHHKDIDTLLAIPHYSNDLQDYSERQESERGQVMVQSRESWRKEMAKWIADAREAELAAAEEPDVPEPTEISTSEQEQAPQTMQSMLQAQHRNPKKWKLMTLAQLFGKSHKESLRVRTARRAMEEAETYMRVMAEVDALDEEDGIVDDGAIEILDDEAYGT